MKRERSSEASESANGTEGAPPGGIGAPSAPSSGTVGEDSGRTVAGEGQGGCTPTPTSSKTGPEEPEETPAPAPAVVHAAGVSIGRATNGPGGPAGGESSAVAREEPAPTAAKSATSVAGAVPGPVTASSAASAGKPATAGEPATSESSAAAAKEPAAEESAAVPSEAASTKTTAAAAGAVAAEPATAASAAATSRPPGSAVSGEGGAPERPGRVSRPMVVAAVFAGALLLATPFVVASAQKDDPKPESQEAAAAWKGDGGAGGYVPGTDPEIRKDIKPVGADKSAGTPARGAKDPVGDVRPDAGGERKPVDRAAEEKTEGGSGAAGRTSGKASGDKAPTDAGPDTPTKAPSAGPAAKAAPAVVYSGVSGPECPTQRFQKSGYYSDGKEGWATHSGGFGGYGCAGKYLSMPMSGSSSKDSGGSATWIFDLPASAKNCAISVHVPGSSDISRVGGDPSYYTVYDRFLPRTSNLVGSFHVRQQDRRGSWYNVPGTFPVDALKLSVRLHDRGEDRDYEHHAISALKVTCTG
ncbi:hypothetical protein [Streptomyces sp. MMBL 11-1]|uniref:hypothetical protein n=1 Tax=Streptomyces sp. MMBL 11-1 TaxID=3026420 RepID=UPI0023629D4F|nr:hypothetical protein [Streptomyces sp. MMBL 11-1]